MTLAQGTGAGLGAILGGVLASALQHWIGYTIDPAAATAIVVAMIGIFGVAGHAVATYGLLGVWSLLLHGSGDKQKPPAG